MENQLVDIAKGIMFVMLAGVVILLCFFWGSNDNDNEDV